VTGAASGTGSANPALGYAVGIGTKAAVDSLQRYISRKRQQAEQDQIAAAVGTLPVGQGTTWQIRHKIPVGNQHGYVTVVRDIPNALAPCKEVVFTVLTGNADSHRGYYTTTACQQGGRWKWALAEPATARWGFLQ
jgi:pectate lyase